tara:strand:+ start:31 stop:522 length:492 start_codon:yes stop_codon:yes gene_type:complete
MAQNKAKIWKEISEIKFGNCSELLGEYKKRRIHASPWIENIVKKYNFPFSNDFKLIKLARIKVEELGFFNQTNLGEIYKKIKDKNLELVPPEIALYSRLIYDEQTTGEWLRFATPLDSMIDTDNVPHLPKIGKALNTYFVETYWSYPKAVFHPHNEFVVIEKN